VQLLIRVASTLIATTLTVVAFAGPAHASVRLVPKPDQSVNPATHADEYENRIVAAVNEFRARRGLPKLRVFQSCLDQHAERWAKHLAASGRLEHRNQYRVLDACKLHWTGETLASGSGSLSPRGMVQAWMHSPPHRAVLMKPRANLAGVAIRRNAQGDVFGVVNLGDPT
jgi:uncharacterized protein YkwD